MAAHLREQSGVISRRQLLATGCAPHDIKRLLRRRDLAPIRRGVYVNHTGTPTWLQQAWSALLTVSSQIDASDVALAHWSALRIAEGPGRDSTPSLPIYVGIPVRRRVRPAPGIVVHRMQHFEHRVQANRYPPRVRYDEAVLDVASTLAPLDALGVLARAVSERRSTASRLLAGSRSRGTLSGRSWIESVLHDIDEGTHSVLEHGFLTRVVRPHGLPTPDRQQREETPIGIAYRDASYGDVLVELDGRLDHTDTAKRDADLDRDLIAMATGRRTARLGWGQVFGRPCQTSTILADVIGRRTTSCGQDCRRDEVLVEAAVRGVNRGFQ